MAASACASSRAMRRMVVALMPVCCAANSGVNRAMSRCHLLQPRDEGRQLARPGQVLREQRIEHAQQKQGIAAGGNEMVFAGHLRGFRAARVDQHQLAAPGLQCLDAVLDVRHGPDAAVGGDGVGPQHQEIVGAIDIGNREQGLVPEQPQGGEVMRQLVHAGGGKAIVGAQVAEQVALVGEHAVVVYRGVAQVNADGIDAIALADLHQPARGGIQRLLPADLLPAAGPARFAHSLQRAAQAVRILVDILQCHRLGADMAAAQRVLLVPLYGDDLLALGLNHQPADSLAQVAGPVVALQAHARCSSRIRPSPEISASSVSRSCCRRCSDTSYSASRVW